MTDSTMPVTMRFDERTIDQLKLKARRAAFEQNKDVSYVDLIRDAVSSTYNIPIDRSFEDLADFCIENESETSEFWVPESIDEFQNSPTGKMISKCIETEEYDSYVKLYKEKLKDWLYNKSIAFKVLRETAGQNGRCIIEKDVTSIAYVIPRRGGVPEQIIENLDSLDIPDFEICAYPSIKITSAKPHNLFDMMVKPIMSIQKELDTNVIRALSTACEYRGDQIIKTTSVSPFDILQALKKLAQHNLTPNAILMHTDQYIDVAALGKDILCAPTLKEAIETKQYGTIQGVPVIVSNRCDIDKIILTPKPKQLGVIYFPKEPTVRHQPDFKKQREGFVASLVCGIAITNDWAVSMIINTRNKRA